MKLQRSILEELKPTAILEYSAEITARNYGRGLLRSYVNHESIHGKALQEEIKNNDYDTAKYQDLLKYIMSELEKADPTSSKSYTPFIAKLYATDDNAYLYKMQVHVKRNLETYDKAKRYNLLKQEHKDIMRFKTIADFILEMESYADKVEELELQREAKHTATVDYEDSMVRVIIPKSEAAACYYGQGTTWCTSATRSSNMFDKYNERGQTLYILLPKQPEYTGEKYQLCFETAEYVDETDTQVALDEIMHRFTPELKEYFDNKLNFPGSINSTNDSILEDITQKIYDILMQEVVYEQILEWQFNDEDYDRYLTDNGYTDEDGEVDWDKVTANGDTYEEWNYEVSDLLKKVNSRTVLSADELRDAAENYLQVLADDGQETDLDSRGLQAIPNVIANAFQDVRRGDFKDLFNEYAKFLITDVFVQYKIKDNEVASYTVGLVQRRGR